MNSTRISEGLEAISPRAIALTYEQVTQARQHCQSIPDPAQQWQTYLNALALFGFEQWLHQRASDILINSSQHSMVYASEVLPVIYNVTINDFKVCLVPVESYPDEVELPSIVMTSPELASHFYVTVAIYEEQSQVVVDRFLRYDQLTTQLRSQRPDTDGLYTLSISHFEPDLDRLLLYLRCSQPAAISLPTTQQSPATPHSPLINVRRWLQNELGELAQQLAWVLMPPLALENAMRSTARVVNQPIPQESFENVIKQLMRDGMTLPADARVAYQDLNVGQVAARLYAIAGTLPPAPTPEWTLLIILGPRSQTLLPCDTQLRIAASNTLLTQQILTEQDNYLYAKVIGTLEEQFEVTITVPDSDPVTLPPFAFQTNR
jgi:Protein of unknown function (DUF1822)